MTPREVVERLDPTNRIWLFGRYVSKREKLSPEERAIKAELEAWIANAMLEYVKGRNLSDALGLPPRKPGPKMPLVEKIRAAWRVVQLEGELGSREAAVLRVSEEIHRGKRAVEGYYDEYGELARLIDGSAELRFILEHR